MLEGDLAVAPERGLEHLRGDERIAVAIAAHPAADRDERRKLRARAIARQARDRILDVGDDARHRVDEGVAEIGERVLDLVAHAQLHRAQHARLPQGGDEAAKLGHARLEVLGKRVRRIHLPEPFRDRELAVERALALHFGRMRREHRLDANRRERERRLLAPRAACAGLGEEPAQRRRQRRRALAPVIAFAADVVAILRDVGEEREVAERANHRHGLLVAEPVERGREPLARGHVLEAPARHREAAYFLDHVEGRRALVGADGVAQEPPEEADVLGEPRVLVVAVVHHGSFPCRPAL